MTVISARFQIRGGASGDAPPADHLQREIAVAEAGHSFWYGFGAGVGNLADESHLLLRSDGTRLWHDIIGAADGSTEFVGDGAGLTGVAADSVDWADVTGTPTTLGGYGITDAAPIAHVGAGGTAHANVVAAGAAGFMTGADKTKLDGIASGANNYSHPNHSGDVTSAGDGATTIATGAVTLAKMANMATASLIYRKTAGTGAPEVNTLATLKTDLGLTGTNSGDQTITLTGMVTGSGTGTFAASLGSFTKAQLSAAVSDGAVLYVGDVTSNATHTGDVTGATALTIANDAVTNAKAANMATATIKGRVTAGTGDPEDLTAAQVRTLINVANGATANTGTVTSVSGAGTVSGLTLTGTVTGSGNLTLGGTLAVTASQISDGSAPGRAALTSTTLPTIGDIGVTDNTIVPGTYIYNSATTSTGAPADVTRGQFRHYRRVIASGGETQEIVVETGTGIAGGTILSRSRVTGAWTDWVWSGSVAGSNTGASFTLTATAGRKIVLIAGGAWGNNTTAQTVTLNYNGSGVASHPLKQAAAADRTSISLTAVVTAVASATVSVTVTGGTLYDPVISWIVI